MMEIAVFTAASLASVTAFVAIVLVVVAFLAGVHVAWRAEPDRGAGATTRAALGLASGSASSGWPWEAAAWPRCRWVASRSSSGPS